MLQGDVMSAISTFLINNIKYDEHRAKRAVKRLKAFLDLKNGEEKDSSDYVLCILAEIVADYYYSDYPAIDSLKKDAQNWYLFDYISNYDSKPNAENNIKKDFNSVNIYQFFNYFTSHCIWLDDELYPSTESYIDTLEYLNTLDKTIFMWAVCRNSNDTLKDSFTSDIKQFALALYKREMLPDIINYEITSDDDIELFNYSYPYDIDEIKNEIAKKNTPISH